MSGRDRTGVPLPAATAHNAGAGDCGIGTPREASPAPVRRRNKSGAIGTKGETAVARYLQRNGFPHAEKRRLRGAQDAGDITGTPGVVWSVKSGHAAENASDLDVTQWLERMETMRINGSALFALLVMKRRGIGYGDAGRWWAVMPCWKLECLMARDQRWWTGAKFPVRMLLSDSVMLLRAAGWGEPP